MNLRHIMGRCMAATLLAFAAFASAPAMAEDAASLRARYADLKDELRDNPYGRAMHIDSAEGDRDLRGDVYAVVDHPFARVNEAMRDPAAWCDIMLLPFNTKYCHAVKSGDDARLSVRIGRKYDQPVEQAYKLDFAFRNLASSADFMESRLNAKEGPVGTRDYRITVAAIPVEGNKTFLHLGYAYGYGTAGKMAMSLYLSTAGSDKVGFSYTGREGGQPQYIGGVRGAIERNVMRYYLAIDAYLDSLDAPRAQQVERRIQAWFSATEKYPKQLHEMDRGTYVAMKRQEYQRQQSVALQ